jgi:hypothetical protein
MIADSLAARPRWNGPMTISRLGRQDGPVTIAAWLGERLDEGDLFIACRIFIPG